ncbi:MAG TPA: hypothetical protein VM286_02110 [Candidatus Thermoplasmatota archaeon]|nr:hypothetical protein [Candidatus Thermoplasmatota archaeon]
MRAMAILLLAMLVAGCLGSSVNDKPDGHFVRHQGGSHSQHCVQEKCRYGSSEPFTAHLACSKAPTLSWESNGWISGTVTARVLDSGGAEVLTQTIGNGQGSKTVSGGTPGIWVLDGSTQDYYGLIEVRLTCQ